MAAAQFAASVPNTPTGLASSRTLAGGGTMTQQQADDLLSSSRASLAAASARRSSHPLLSVASLISHSCPRRVLVVGGSGFVGRHLIQTLLGLGHEVRCFDCVQSFADARVLFYQGDLTAAEDATLLGEACADVDTVFHTASLTDPLATFAAIRAVNVFGTEAVVRACVEAGVRNLIYVSTTAVIFAGRDIEGATEEECPYPRSYLDAYSQCKAEAERLVVAANGTVSPLTGQSLCTVSLRPHAIFGPRDTHFISQLLSRARHGDITHMIGSGKNRVDFTYVGNVVHALILTMHQLSDPAAKHGEPPAMEYATNRARIGGQCYFITNGEPRPFWAFVNTILTETGCVGPTKKIHFAIAYVIAAAMECLQWLAARLPAFFRVRMEPTLTRHMVCVMGRHQWYSCAKATRDLGYAPIMSVDDGLAATIGYFFRRRNGKMHLQPTQHHHTHQHAHHQQQMPPYFPQPSPPTLPVVNLHHSYGSAPKLLRANSETLVGDGATAGTSADPARGTGGVPASSSWPNTVRHLAAAPAAQPSPPLQTFTYSSPYPSPPGAPGSNVASPTSRWPARWTPSPHDERAAAAAAAAAGMYLPPSYAPAASYPSPYSSTFARTYAAQYLPPGTALYPGEPAGPIPISSRGSGGSLSSLRQVPSSAFLNAYSHPAQLVQQMHAAAQQQQHAHHHHPPPPPPPPPQHRHRPHRHHHRHHQALSKGPHSRHDSPLQQEQTPRGEDTPDAGAGTSTTDTTPQ